MSVMVERVARALTARCGVDPDDIKGGVWDGGSYASGIPAWTAWTDDARAAIAVMREPTDAMCRAEGEEVTGARGTLPGRGNETDYWTPDDIWRAMIDKALKP